MYNVCSFVPSTNICWTCLKFNFLCCDMSCHTLKSPRSPHSGLTFLQLYHWLKVAPLVRGTPTLNIKYELTPEHCPTADTSSNVLWEFSFQRNKHLALGQSMDWGKGVQWERRSRMFFSCLSFSLLHHSLLCFYLLLFPNTPKIKGIAAISPTC